MTAAPKVSIFTASKNGARFLRDTVESILAQSYRDYEHVIVDGASTDGSQEILAQYPHLRWISEPDSCAAEGFHKAVRLCRGEYLFQCCVSDGFLDPSWMETCVGILDSNPEISLVYGVQRNMTEAGELRRVAYQELLADPPPQGADFFPFWLATRFHYPEPNYCVRREVFLECFPEQDAKDYFESWNPFLSCVYTFNVRGYLPYFAPVVANYYRTHQEQLTEGVLQHVEATNEIYNRMVHDYAARVFAGEVRHRFRNGAGQVIGEVDAARLAGVRRRVIACAYLRRIYFGASGTMVERLGPLRVGERAMIALLAPFSRLKRFLGASLDFAAGIKGRLLPGAGPGSAPNSH